MHQSCTEVFNWLWVVVDLLSVCKATISKIMRSQSFKNTVLSNVTATSQKKRQLNLLGLDEGQTNSGPSYMVTMVQRKDVTAPHNLQWHGAFNRSGCSFVCVNSQSSHRSRLWCTGWSHSSAPRRWHPGSAAPFGSCSRRFGRPRPRSGGSGRWGSDGPGRSRGAGSPAGPRPRDHRWSRRRRTGRRMRKERRGFNEKTTSSKEENVRMQTNEGKKVKQVKN